MKASASSVPVFFVLALFFVLSISSLSVSMAENPTKPDAGQEEASVQIVYVDRPEGEEPEAFHLRTLTKILGSEEAAKEAVIYHYKHAASGFSAKLTPKQVEELAKQPEVVQILPSKSYQLHGAGTGAGTAGVM